MKRFLFLALGALFCFGALMLLRQRGSAGEGAPGTVLARERAAAHFEHGQWAQARAALAPLVTAAAPQLEDLERAAAVEYMARDSGGQAEPWFARIRALDPADPALHYMEARMRLEAGDFAQALEHFRAVLRVRPDDLATRIGLASTLADTEQPEEARALLEGLVALGVEHAGGWYVQAVYRLAQLTQRAGPPERAQQLYALFQQLQELGYRSASADELDRGTLGIVRPPAPGGVEGAQPGSVPRFASEPAILPELADARELFALDLDGNGDTDFLAAGPRGVLCALRGVDGYALETALAGAVEHVRAFDLGNDDSLDLVVSRGAELVLLEHRSGAELLLGASSSGLWAPSSLALPTLAAPPADMLLVDFDHDGDLDLLLVGPFGARLLRNDGAAARRDALGIVTRGSFVDASREASLPALALTWCASEDFDGDQDVDLLLGGPDALFLMSNLRGGKFADVAPSVLAGVRGFAREPLVADLDGDARADLFVPGAPSTLWRQRADGTFGGRETPLAVGADAEPQALDLDLDGTLDLLWAGTDAVAEGALGFGLAVERPARIAGRASRGPLVCADLDRDLDLDLARLTEQGLEILRCAGPVGHAARLAPLGLKDNRRALGAIVETRTRGLYRRLYWRGEPQLVGCGPYPSLDVVRITWPNGVVQTRLDVEAKEQPFLDTAHGALEQTDSLVGSCPFLYAWNGRTYGFVSDVLGGTPLGLPLAPGQLVPPDHDEFVLVRGDQLVPREGKLELQLTEELREVTYLDRVRLDVIDHPAEAAIYPNERFTFPPFPEAHVHSVRAPLAPLRATGSDGKDWTRALARIDDVHAEPFTPLEAQFLGLATPHWLELEFDPTRVKNATHLRLVCTGWFFWTDASVNMASARTPGVEFVPPILQLLGPDGAWHDAAPPLGFPAGKSKTMVIELDALLAGWDRARPRLRLFSTLRLYWDSLQLAVDDDDAELRVTPLEPEHARLWSRGFSRPLPTQRSDLPERFQWDALAERPRWNPHPGRYTRYGETLELVQAIDDRLVILGSGDALTLTFDARVCPPLPAGWTRDYLLFLDGWAKDRDPNTVEALTVEPLPFHGMSAYPYAADEHFPSDELHERWRREWNTREARPWIVPLAPQRQAEWSLELAGRR